MGGRKSDVEFGPIVMVVSPRTGFSAVANRASTGSNSEIEGAFGSTDKYSMLFLVRDGQAANVQFYYVRWLVANGWVGSASGYRRKFS